MHYPRNLVEKRTLQILGVLLLLSLWFQSWPISLGLLLGGLLGILNFHWLWWITRKIILENKKLLGVQFIGKFFFLAAIIFLILRGFHIHALAFLVGISTIIPALISAGWQKAFLEKGGHGL